MKIRTAETNHYRKSIFGLLYLFLLLSPLTAKAEEPAKPAPPELSVPEISKDATTIFEVGGGVKFAPPGHNASNDALLSNLYVGELRKAIYWQDTYHQFESKVHFDNCDFDGAITYIDELLKEVGKNAEEVQRANNRHDAEAVKSKTIMAFFTLGQALHVAQDFYAHTNYVELKAKDARRLDGIPLVLPWTEDGKQTIRQLRKEGLLSGVVFWGFPQVCPGGTISHGKLAKDSNATQSGKVRVSSLENKTRYEIALYLARETSKELIAYTFSRWPVLQELNGSTVAFDTLIDRRGIP